MKKEILIADNIDNIYNKLVDCLEKCLIYGHIRRFADWFYYSFTTFNELSLDMQKAPAKLPDRPLHHLTRHVEKKK